MQPAMKFGGGAPFQVGMTPWSPNPEFTVISFISLEKRERSNYVSFSIILLILLLLYVRSKVPKEEREPITEENQASQQQPEDTTASKEQESIAQEPAQQVTKRRKRKRNKKRKMAGDRVQQDDYYRERDDDRYYKKKSKSYGDKRKSNRRRYRENQDQDYSESHTTDGSARRSKTRDHDDTTNSVISTDGAGGGSSDTTSTKRSSRRKRSTRDHPTYEQSSDPLLDDQDQQPYRVERSNDQEDAEQQVEIPEQDFAPPRIGKDTTLPEKFLSSPTMEQLGLEEQDARKFMQAMKAYNKLMAEETMKQKMLDEEQALPVVDEKNDQQEHAQQQPLPETQDANGSSQNLIENNIKYEKPSKPTLEDLVGKKVNKDGSVVDDQGNVLGKVSRDMSYLDGKVVNENGDIVDDSGNVYGKAEPVDPPASSNKNKKGGSSLAVRNGDEDVIVNVDAHKGGISFSIHIPRAK